MPHEQGGAAATWIVPWNAATVSNQSIRRSVELAAMAYRDTAADSLPPHLAWDELRRGRSVGLRYRRAVTALSVAGMVSMAMVSLYQMGVLRHLPDPPLRRFHSDQVNAAVPAHRSGIPDGAVAMASHALNVALAGLGGQRRAQHMPWVPLALAGKAAVEAAVAARALVPVVKRSWCAYRVADAMVRIGIFVCSLPEALEVVRASLERNSYRRQP